MSAVLKETPSNISALFARMAVKAPSLRETTAPQRAEKIRRRFKAIIDSRDAILAAGKKELRLVDLDIDAQLLMVKSEADHIARNLSKWMARQAVDGTLMSVGKKCYIQYEPKGVVLHVSTW